MVQLIVFISVMSVVPTLTCELLTSQYLCSSLNVNDQHCGDDDLILFSSLSSKRRHHGDVAESGCSVRFKNRSESLESPTTFVCCRHLFRESVCVVYCLQSRVAILQRFTSL